MTLNTRLAPFCCYLEKNDQECKRTPEFRIYTQRRDGSPAGPDIYADQTEACVVHVGHLLGHQPEAKNPEEIGWWIADLGTVG